MNKEVFWNKRIVWLIVSLFLCFFILPLTTAYAQKVATQEKPLKSEEVMNLRNYELRLQNMELQMELIRRELDKLVNERDVYIKELFKSYELNQGWRIDLDKGVWVIEKAPESEKAAEKEEEKTGK